MILALIGVGLGLVGSAMIGVSAYLNISASVRADEPADVTERPTVNVQAQPGQANRDGNRRGLPTLTPTPPQGKTMSPAPTATQASPTTPAVDSFDHEAAADDVTENGPTSTAAATMIVASAISQTAIVTNTPSLTQDVAQSVVTSTVAISAGGISTDINVEPTEQVQETVQYVEPYTSTDQVKPPPSTNPGPGEETATACPTTSETAFDLIPIEGKPMTNHPDYLHGDLNLSLRGYIPISESLKLVHYNGNADPQAPQLHGLFEPNRQPKIKQVYQVNEWIWDSGQCGGDPRGCRGEPINVFWPVTLAGLATTPGEPIFTPERAPQIYRGGFIAMVLYAEAQRLTLGYTRRDNVAAGYVVHIENVCVDPNLLALYQAQKNTDGQHTSGFLPALRNNQALGVAAGQEIQVAIRDVGSFMDPRSQKDWWR